MRNCVLCDKLSQGAKVEVGGNFGISDGEWQGSTLPPYCHGVGYLFPTPSLRKVLAATDGTRYLRVEDVFMTGVLARLVL